MLLCVIIVSAAAPTTRSWCGVFDERIVRHYYQMGEPHAFQARLLVFSLLVERFTLYSSIRVSLESSHWCWKYYFFGKDG